MIQGSRSLSEKQKKHRFGILGYFGRDGDLKRQGPREPRDISPEGVGAYGKRSSSFQFLGRVVAVQVRREAVEKTKGLGASQGIPFNGWTCTPGLADSFEQALKKSGARSLGRQGVNSYVGSQS